MEVIFYREKKAMTDYKSGIFVNSDGVSFRVKGLAPMTQEQVRSSFEESYKERGLPIPSTPKYTVVSASGEEAIFDHDETTIKDADAETRAKYDEWRKFEKDKNTALLYKAFLCVIVDDDSIREWEQEEEAVGIPVPKNPVKKRIAYVQNRVVKNTDDIANLMIETMMVSGTVPEDKVKIARESFRSAMERAQTGVS